MSDLLAVEELIDIWEKKKELIYTRNIHKDPYLDYQLLSLYTSKEELIKKNHKELKDKDIDQLITIRRELKIKYLSE